MDDDKNLTLVGHLEELRTRLIISIVIFSAAAIFCFAFSLPIIKALSSGLNQKLIFLAPFDAFMARIKVSVLFGTLLSMPVIVFEVWLFIKPALKTQERKYALPFIAGTIFAFYAGIFFAYLLLPMGIKFLLSMGGDIMKPQMAADKYISYVFSTYIVFGLLFEFPVVIALLAKLNIVTAEFLRQKRKYAFLGIITVAAVVTPSQDAFTLVMLSVPLLFLYEVSIFLAKFMVKGN